MNWEKSLPPNYVVITPARDEARYIGGTIESMVAQSFRPIKWVIVDDGSTDETGTIVERYLPMHPWIELVRMPERKKRHFGGKVFAFQTGFDRVSHLEFEVVGNLDADVTFDSTLFETLMKKFAEDPELGVGGAPFREGGGQYDFRFANIENVWGGCQFFRRQCYLDIGGYVPVERGAVDHIAVVTARMKGWKTRTFTENICIHHRSMGTAGQHILSARLRMGKKDYSVGNSPIWEFFRVIYQMRARPFVIGGLAVGTGYFWELLCRAPRPVSREFVEFTRMEQMVRLRRLFGGRAVGVPIRTGAPLRNSPKK